MIKRTKTQEQHTDIMFSPDITDIHFSVDQKETPLGHILQMSDQNPLLSVMTISYWGETE